MKKVKSSIPRTVKPPIRFCQGCHYGIIIRVLGEVMEEMEIDGRAVFINSGGCSVPFGGTYLDVDNVFCGHGPAIAAGAAVKKCQPDSVVVVIQGDGELGAIGPGYLINSLLRGDNITVIGLNNAVYGMTGGQMAATTPLGMRTITTPEGRDKTLHGSPFRIAELVAFMDGSCFSARVSVHNPAERQRAKKALRTAFEKQLERRGFSYVEFISACPSNWHLNPPACLKFIDEKMIPVFPLGIFKDA